MGVAAGTCPEQCTLGGILSFLSPYHGEGVAHLHLSLLEECCDELGARPLAPPLHACCVLLPKLLNLSVPQCLHL